MKIKCYKCNGKGVLTHIDWFVGTLTLGLTALMDYSNKKKCNACRGKGYIKIKS